MAFEIQRVAYDNVQQMNALCQLLNAYASEPMGGGKPLSPDTIKELPQAMMDFPTTFSFLGVWDGEPVSIANGFFGFSTFAARKVLNLHDLFVAANARGRGLGWRMLEHLEQFAREHDCAKLTLEVLQSNETAMGLYRKFGFAGYELCPEAGQAMFWQKSLAD